MASLPKRQYFTLQQAVDELNKYFHGDKMQPVIDIDYLMHLGVTSRLPFYVASDKDWKISFLSAEGDGLDAFRESSENRMDYFKTKNYYSDVFFKLRLTDVRVFLNNDSLTRCCFSDVSIYSNEKTAFISAKQAALLDLENLPKDSIIFELHDNYIYEYYEDHIEGHGRIPIDNDDKIVLDRNSLLVLSPDLEALKNGIIIEGDAPNNPEKEKLYEENRKRRQSDITKENNSIKDLIVALASKAGIDLFTPSNAENNLKKHCVTVGLPKPTANTIVKIKDRFDIK